MIIVDMKVFHSVKQLKVFENMSRMRKCYVPSCTLQLCSSFPQLWHLIRLNQFSDIVSLLILKIKENLCFYSTLHLASSNVERIKVKVGSHTLGRKGTSISKSHQEVTKKNNQKVYFIRKLFTKERRFMISSLLHTNELTFACLSALPQWKLTQWMFLKILKSFFEPRQAKFLCFENDSQNNATSGICVIMKQCDNNFCHHPII